MRTASGTHAKFDGSSSSQRSDGARLETRKLNDGLILSGGNVAEIGVFKGRYFLTLATCLKHLEIAIAIEDIRRL